MHFFTRFRTEGKGTTGGRSKKSISNVGLHQSLEVHSPWCIGELATGPMLQYYSPIDVGRTHLRVTNPDIWGETPRTACFTPVPAITKLLPASREQPEDRAIEELQDLPGHHGRETETESRDHAVDIADEGLLIQADESTSSADAKLSNRLGANPPTPCQNENDFSWLHLDAFDDEDELDHHNEPQPEQFTVPKASQSKPFNPVTVEDCPPDAVPPMHGPGSRYFQYAEPDSFRTPSKRAKRKRAKDSMMQGIRSVCDDITHKSHTDHQPNSVPELETVCAQIVSISRPSAMDRGTEEEDNLLGHHLDQGELILQELPAAPHHPASESQVVRKGSNRQRLVEHGRNVLSSVMHTVTAKPRAELPQRRGLELKDLHSWQHRHYRFGPEPGCRWDKYAVIEGLNETVPSLQRCLPSFSKIRLTLKHSIFRAEAPVEALCQTGYFTTRHQKRQDFLRRTHSEVTKKTKKTKKAKTLEMPVVSKYLGDALSDLGTFEFDFSSFRIE